MNYKLYLFTSMFLVLVSTMFAQIPSELPNPDDNKPIDITNPADLILYIILPLVVILLVIIKFRKKKK